MYRVESIAYPLTNTRTDDIGPVTFETIRALGSLFSLVTCIIFGSAQATPNHLFKLHKSYLFQLITNYPLTSVNLLVVPAMIADLKKLYKNGRDIPGTFRKVSKGKGTIEFGTLLS